ncbi:MAG: hypothetical protein ACOH1T_09690 [Microbacteriaceae bacterium]
MTNLFAMTGLPTDVAVGDASPAGAAIAAARQTLDAQYDAIVRARSAFTTAVSAIPRSAGAARGGTPPSTTEHAPWKGPARRAFDASLYEIERAVIDARDALAIAEDYTRRALEGLDHAG